MTYKESIHTFKYAKCIETTKHNSFTMKNMICIALHILAPPYQNISSEIKSLHSLITLTLNNTPTMLTSRKSNSV